MEKDVISEADDTIVIDVPEQKEYVISIANNSYKIKPIFSIYVYEQLIEDINEENWKNNFFFSICMLQNSTIGNK